MQLRMQASKISTAIPQRRFRIGNYTAVLLGDIDSPDAARYRYILALVRDGEPQPSCYITCEKSPRARTPEGSHFIRIISEDFTEDMGASDAWSDADAFATDALAMAAQVLGLGDEAPQPLG